MSGLTGGLSPKVSLFSPEQTHVKVTETWLLGPPGLPEPIPGEWFPKPAGFAMSGSMCLSLQACPLRHLTEQLGVLFHLIMKSASSRRGIQEPEGGGFIYFLSPVPGRMPVKEHPAGFEQRAPELAGRPYTTFRVSQSNHASPEPPKSRTRFSCGQCQRGQDPREKAIL